MTDVLRSEGEGRTEGRRRFGLGAGMWTVVLGLAVGAAGPPALAQTPPRLNIQMNAGQAQLTVTGAAGAVYSLEYSTDLARMNTPSAWRCLEYLQLPASPYLWADKSAPATGMRFYRVVEMVAPSNMVFIPPGKFTMGSPDSVPLHESEGAFPEGPQTQVILTKGFWLGKYEVTQREYLAVMGNNPSWFNGDRRDEAGENYGTNLERPVESMTWYEATNYCAKLTEQERAAGRIAINSAYRLPTEAEWEYACRAGTSTLFSFGDDDANYARLRDYAWVDANSDERTHPVGQKLPNPWGLYDMHGNVWEWCQDWLSEHLPGGTVVDLEVLAPWWGRTVRGGAEYRNGYCARSAFRSGRQPVAWGHGVGFRAALVPVR